MEKSTTMSRTDVEAVPLDRDLITSLQSQIESLQHRVKELKDENAKLSSQVSNCSCHNKISESKEVKSSTHNNKTRKKKSNEQISGSNMRIMSHHPKRYVALKVMYFGLRFYGFASEAQMDPTIESEIFNALEKTRLLVGDKKESQYSRCGRTDKGVSSVGQVVALFLRSNLKGGTNCGEVVPEEQYEGEIDYVRVLNRVLPSDIRILGWCPAPVGFSARFTCLSREYKYLFWRQNLNLQALESAGKKLIGEHDFRNFCKMDAANVHNYSRRITSFEISPCNKRFEDDQLWSIRLRGSAFLWHQVRCMVAVLFMIGQGLESPDVIDTLLDTDRTPRKPQYSMASELPLILQSCEFEGLEFICSSDALQALRVHLEDECHNYQLQAAIFHEALLSQLAFTSAKDLICLDNGTVRKKASHAPLMSRPTEPSYEERRAKLNSRTRREELIDL